MLLLPSGFCEVGHVEHQAAAGVGLSKGRGAPKEDEDKPAPANSGCAADRPRLQRAKEREREELRERQREKEREREREGERERESEQGDFTEGLARRLARSQRSSTRPVEPRVHSKGRAAAAASPLPRSPWPGSSARYPGSSNCQEANSDATTLFSKAGRGTCQGKREPWGGVDRADLQESPRRSGRAQAPRRRKHPYSLCRKEPVAVREQQTLRPSVETPGLPAAKLEVLLQGMRYVRHHLGDQERGKRGGDLLAP